MLVVGSAVIATEGAAVAGVATVLGKAVGKAVVGDFVTCKVGSRVCLELAQTHSTMHEVSQLCTCMCDVMSLHAQYNDYRCLNVRENTSIRALYVHKLCSNTAQESVLCGGLSAVTVTHIPQGE
jgi:hypothetical protein